MKNTNKKKAEQLGMPPGTANARLRKLIMFNLVQQTNRDICFQCGERIDNVKDFSIEHKKAWLDNDSELFWDLENIAFSHLHCNIGARRTGQKKKPIPHNTHSGYSRHGCRCEDCTKAHKEYNQKQREK